VSIPSIDLLLLDDGIPRHHSGGVSSNTEEGTETEVLRLRVPEAGSRPGRRPTYLGLDLSSAGEVDRPPVDAEAGSIVELSRQLIRVLDDDGVAVGPWAGEMEASELIDGLRQMMLVRAFDARMLLAHRQGKISFYMQSLGEEAISCAHRQALRPDDMCFPTYRQQGLLISSGYPLVDMMNQVFSNSRDPMKGRQLPVFYSSKAYGFFTISGNLATQFVQAVGWAMASAIAGDSRIASAWIGEGASAESDFHAAMVFASTYQVPVVLNIVNNQWAISTYQGFARGASETFAARGLGFGIPALRADGNDFRAVRAVSTWAAERARRNLGPTLIEWVTLRAGAHSTSDDPSAYRSADDVRSWPLGDPIERLKLHLIGAGQWDQRRHDHLTSETDGLVSAAAEEAESYGTVHGGEVSSPSTMFQDVFAVVPPHLLAQRQRAGF